MKNMYAELRTKTCFSFLRGASHPEELVAAAARLHLAGLGVADVETLAGVVEAHVAAKAAGLRLLVGAELHPQDGPACVLYPTDRAAYGRLSSLITLGRRRAPKGTCALRWEDLLSHAEGQLALLVPPRDVPLAGSPEEASLARALEGFPERGYLVAEHHLGPGDGARLLALEELAGRLHVPLVAANDVHYHERSRSRLQDVLTCIRHGRVIDAAGDVLFPNAERYLKSEQEMRQLFAAVPGAVERTGEVLARVGGCMSASAAAPGPSPRGSVQAPCAGFSLDELRYEYPDEIVPPGETPASHLARLAREGATQRYPEGVPEKVAHQIERELSLIAELRYEPFFLTVYDVVRFARGRGILCQGRGSAANSAVCYTIGITSVDPARSDLLFERFLSKERNEPPDIDVDFEHERREEVLQYIYEKYGRERAGIVAEVIRYRGRSAVRDVGKALGLSLDQVDRLAGELHWWSEVEDMDAATRRAGIDPGEPRVRMVLERVREIQGLPRHLSQHVGGFVITRGPLSALVPIENAAMEGRTVIEWDKEGIEALGILKVDCLALGMLTCIRKTFGLIEMWHGKRYELATIPAEDPATYAMASQADTVGVFQIESRAQQSMLPRLRPRTFYDLVIQVAIVRPGPIQGGMVHPYMRRRNGEEAVTYPSEALQEVLHRTLGVPLFQEQAMRLSIVAAGFTPGEADQLRRAMGAWRKSGVMETMREKLVTGMLRNGYTGELAHALFEQLKGFGEYGFPESHAASFALLAYVSAWCKRHHPAAYAAALLNSQPMGFYAPAQIVRDALEHAVPVRPVDVAWSAWDCALEAAEGEDPAGGPEGAGRKSGTGGAGDAPGAGAVPEERAYGRGGPALRLGMRLVKGLSQAAAEAIVAARGAGGPFHSLAEVARRAGLPAEPMARLAAANAFRSLSLSPREALWEVEALGAEREMPLFAGLFPEEEAPRLPRPGPAERVVQDYATVGLSLERHPVSFLRERLARLGAVPASRLAGLRTGAPVVVGGLVTIRQRPATAKGIIFISLEDETGVAQAIVRTQVAEQFRAACFGAAFLLVTGRLERQGDVIHVLARRLATLPGIAREEARREPPTGSGETAHPPARRQRTPGTPLTSDARPISRGLCDAEAERPAVADSRGFPVPSRDFR